MLQLSSLRQPKWWGSGTFLDDIGMRRRQDWVTAGTILHRNHRPLKKWFLVWHIVATHSNGISALQLQGQLGSGS